MEATFLLGVSLLRQSKLEGAEVVFREAIGGFQPGQDEKSESEILKEVARALPPAARHPLLSIRGEVVLMLPLSDRLALPAPHQATTELNLGKRIKGFVKRVIWRVVCEPRRPIYKAWSAKLPEVYSSSYFAGAVATAFENFRIGAQALAVGLVAILMKSTAAEFCQATSPTPVMEARRKSKP